MKFIYLTIFILCNSKLIFGQSSVEFLTPQQWTIDTVNESDILQKKFTIRNVLSDTIKIQIENLKDNEYFVRYLENSFNLIPQVLVIPPHQCGEITIVYTPTNRKGEIDLYFPLGIKSHNSKDIVVEYIQLHTFVKSLNMPIIQTDSNLYNLGTLLFGEFHTYLIRIINTGNSDLEIYDCITTVGNINAKMRTKIIKPGEFGYIELYISASTAKGEMKNVIIVKSNSDRPSIKIPFRILFI